jgi:hypothetical protein
VSEARARAHERAHPLRFLRHPRDGRDVDADREHVRPQHAVALAHARVGQQHRADLALPDAVAECAQVAAGLEADDVVLQHRLEQVAVAGQRAQHVVRREGRVQEESDRLARAEATQLRAERDQVIVVHPDHVVGLEQRQQPARERRVDLLVCVQLVAVVGEEAQRRMQHRPQHVVAVAVVVLVELPAVERHRRVRHAAAPDDIGLAVDSRAELAVPAEPESPVALERRAQADGEPAGHLLLRGIRDAIRDRDEAAHKASSHDLLRRIAAVMIPTML